MTSEEFAAIIGAEFDVIGPRSPRARYLCAAAQARVLTAGREYADSDAVQGFEQRDPQELVNEIEAELADAAAWAVALSIRMSHQDRPIWITKYLTALSGLVGDLIVWRIAARDASRAWPSTALPMGHDHPHQMEGA